MDFSFVESLLQNGASVKSSDKHGQTIFHEVARSWHTDVAQFLLTQGRFRKLVRFNLKVGLES
jgi:ankyrin repeat protein